MSESTSKPIIILGAGGHAKVVADALIQAKYDILFFLTPDKNHVDEIFGLPILGNDNEIDAYSTEEVLLANGIGSLPHQNLRFIVADKMRKKGFKFVKVIHASSTISPNVKLEEGVQIMAGAVIQASTYIGIDTIINTGALIDHDCRIAKNCNIAPGVVCSGGVTVESGVYIGTGSMIIENVSIGKNSMIAAGSVVYRDIPDDIDFIQSKNNQSTIRDCIS